MTRVDAIERQTGQRLGKRQVEELAGLAAMDFEDFYAARRPARRSPGDLLVLSADGKGIVMRPDALRTRAPARPRAGPAPKPGSRARITLNRKRMAEIGAVYDATPAPRTPADILTSAAPEGYQPAPGPVARNKWLSASVVNARRRRSSNASSTRPTGATPNTAAPGSRWSTAPTTRSTGSSSRLANASVKVTIVVDFVHVLRIPVERRQLPARRQRPDRRAMGAPPGDQGTPRTRPQGRRHDPPHKPPTPASERHQRKPADDAANYLTNKAPYLDYPTALAQRLADRDRDHRRRLPPPRQRPDGHHRRPLGTRRRRSDPQTTRHQSQRRLRRSTGDYHLTQERHHVHEARYHDHTIPSHVTVNLRAHFRRAAPLLVWGRLDPKRHRTHGPAAPPHTS